MGLGATAAAASLWKMVRRTALSVGGQAEPLAPAEDANQLASRERGVDSLYHALP